MNISAVREIANNKNVETTGLNKSSLIKAIQLKEGNFDCYGTASKQQCDQYTCTWRDDCFSVSNEV